MYLPRRAWARRRAGPKRVWWALGSVGPGLQAPGARSRHSKPSAGRALGLRCPGVDQQAAYGGKGRGGFPEQATRTRVSEDRGRQKKAVCSSPRCAHPRRRPSGAPPASPGSPAWACAEVCPLAPAPAKTLHFTPFPIFLYLIRVCERDPAVAGRSRRAWHTPTAGDPGRAWGLGARGGERDGRLGSPRSSRKRVLVAEREALALP